MSFLRKGIQKKQPVGAASQRQLRVGEDLRHLIANVFMQGDVYHPELEGISITVTCVTVGPDLRQALVYVLPLGIHEADRIKQIIHSLNEVASQVRHAIAPKITFKYVPEIRFQEDKSFSYGSKIEALLAKTNQQED